MMKVFHICSEREKMKIAVISVTEQGDIIAEKLKECLDIDLYSRESVKKSGIKVLTEKIIKEYKAIIFVSSTGIAVRAIANYLESKDKDPAILVIDSSSKFVISLLSGHLGGANELTLKVANILKSIPVITTATDNMGVTAPDIIAKNYGLVIDDLKDAKKIAALLVDKKQVAFLDKKNIITLPKGYTSNIKEAEGVVYVTHNLKENSDIYKKNMLRLIRKDIILGIGCRKDFDPERMRDSVDDILAEYNLDKRAVKAVATVEIKKDEKAILKLKEYLECELKIFSLEEIRKIHHKYLGSDFVEKTIGVRAVCEPCVELMGAELITEKIKANGMTICIGQI
ncbi:cobalamin (vitamin B12) biosynthesis CbiG protein [Clostridium carboxidivorans P7]|uniref:Cobalamin (Vitamin B12) biosynthesis CbiG protein n=2 Tax=Clostridium TaxID=1485 RepID=C6PWW5_9CLOT|nr:cobalamin (vitamin B12) biosynthesis CbiG protein [Clostridium carboxidivorans P7]